MKKVISAQELTEEELNAGTGGSITSISENPDDENLEPKILDVGTPDHKICPNCHNSDFERFPAFDKPSRGKKAYLCKSCGNIVFYKE